MSLGLSNLKYIQDLATKHSIDITNKSMEKLISEIYKKIKTVDVKTPAEDVINVEIYSNQIKALNVSYR